MEFEEEIKKVKESLKNRATTNMLSEMRKDLEQRIDKLQEEIENKSSDKDKNIIALKDELSVLKGEIDRLETEKNNIKESVSQLQTYFLKYEKVNRKLKNIEEVLGVEEDVDVNKIPPSILRLVYQYTLNDAISTLRRYVGANDAERIIEDVLQNVRTKTSGTELFKLKDGKIEAKDIEIAIKRKLISPKQIHLTYIEIINSMKEYLPGYVPKNFASLLRTKGQEYAIETSTENRLRVEMLERSLESLKNEMAYQENALREDISETKRLIEMELNEKSEAILGRVESIESEMGILKEEIEKLYNSLTMISPYIDALHKSIYEELLSSIPAEGIEKDKLSAPPDIVNDFLVDEVNRGMIIIEDDTIYDVEKIKARLLEIIGEEGASFSALKKESGYSKSTLLTVLEWLKKDGVIEEKKYGKGKKYKRR